jgi:hypothetical protein
MPHALQRLGGVRCTSCHGPGAIPEPAGRARILRASVCATCHDAPPAYTHVDEWSHSAMARADRDAEARHTPACARCHTTGGFLDHAGVRRRDDLSHDPDDAVVGIACAACHAPHGAHEGEALVRQVDENADLAPGTAARSVCGACHSPGAEDRIPSASSAPIVAGRIHLPDALGGGEERGAAPHAALPGGCTACHGASGDGSTAVDHRFQVDTAVCAKCHSAGVQTAGDGVVQRARALLDAVGKRCRVEGDVAHAHPDALATCGLSRDEARRLYLTALVAGDGGAAVHNPAFAERLLSASISSPGHSGAPP